MKSFKQFRSLREENEEQKFEQGKLDKSGVPNVLIQTPTDEERLLVQQKQEANLGEDAGADLKYQAAKAYHEFRTTNHNPHLGEKISDVHQNLSNPDDISDHERPHIIGYTKSSRHLNAKLYEHHMEGWDTPKTAAGRDHGTFHTTKEIDKATSVPLDHDLHVHTGVRFHPGEVAAKHPEGHVHLPAFTSTSINAGVASDFTYPVNGENHVLHVHMKAGDKGRYVGHVSHHQHEKEFVLPRQTTLKIHPHPDKYLDGAGSAVNVWHATVHHQKDLTQDPIHQDHDE